MILLRKAREPATTFFPAINDFTKQLGGTLGIVGGGVRLVVVESNARFCAGLCQHGLAVGQAGERCGIKKGKRMERVAVIYS